MTKKLCKPALKSVEPTGPTSSTKLEKIGENSYKTDTGAIINFVPVPMTSEREAARDRFFASLLAMEVDEPKPEKQDTKDTEEQIP